MPNYAVRPQTLVVLDELVNVNNDSEHDQALWHHSIVCSIVELVVLVYMIPSCCAGGPEFEPWVGMPRMVPGA